MHSVLNISNEKFVLVCDMSCSCTLSVISLFSGSEILWLYSCLVQGASVSQSKISTGFFLIKTYNLWAQCATRISTTSPKLVMACVQTSYSCFWTQKSFCLVNAQAICAIFLHNWTQCINGFSPLLERYVRKGNDAMNPATLRFFSVTKRTQLNAVHA